MRANSSGIEVLEKRRRFEAFFRDHYNRLQQYVGRRAPRAQVDDIVGATFVVAWRKFDQAEEANLPWLLRIAIFEMKSSSRSARHDRHLLGSEMLEGVANTVEEIFDGEPLRQALTELSDVDQEILRLVHWDELTRIEIGEVLGLAVSAVNMRYYRAIARLEQRLSPTAPTTNTPEEASDD
jgi:RNA polymerase sigma-70 factor, ECF subfamily